MLSASRRGGRVAPGLTIRRGPHCVRLTGEGLHEVAMLAPSSHVPCLRVLLFTSLVFMGSASFGPTDDYSRGLGAHGKWTKHSLRGNDPIGDSRRLDGGSAVPKFGGSIRVWRPCQNPLPSDGNCRWLPTLRTG